MRSWERTILVRRRRVVFWKHDHGRGKLLSEDMNLFVEKEMWFKRPVTAKNLMGDEFINLLINIDSGYRLLFASDRSSSIFG